jgi:hypothetical protein
MVFLRPQIVSIIFIHGKRPKETGIRIYDLLWRLWIIFSKSSCACLVRLNRGYLDRWGYSIWSAPERRARALQHSVLLLLSKDEVCYSHQAYYGEDALQSGSSGFRGNGHRRSVSWYRIRLCLPNIWVLDFTRSSIGKSYHAQQNEEQKKASKYLPTILHISPFNNGR